MGSKCDKNKLVVQLNDYPITTWEGTVNVVPNNTMHNEGPPIRKLFVGNIYHRSTYRDLVHLFSAYGKVKDAHVSRNRFTNTKKNYGFVTFVRPEDAAVVLSLHNGELQLHGRTLYVSPADSWHQPRELPDGTVLWKSRESKYSSASSEESEDGKTTGNSKDGKTIVYVHSENGKTNASSNSKAGKASTSGYSKGGKTIAASNSKGRKTIPDGNSEDGKAAACGSSENVEDAASVSPLDAAPAEPMDEERQTDKDDIREEDCKIRILNDDCLMHVFSFLSIRERIKIERVCKRWQEVCWKMWMSQKHLEFTGIFHPSLDVCLDDSILTAFLQRCGRNLKSLDVSHKPYKLGNHVTKIIGKYCQQLERLNLSGLPISGLSLRPLYPLTGELRYLNLDACHGVPDKDLQNFFYKCKSLDSLILSKHHNLTGRCLMGLAQCPLKHLVLDDCNNLRSKFLIRGLSNLLVLNSLSLNSCISLTSTDVSGIVTAVPRLQSLSMSRYFPLFSNSTLQPLSKLKRIIVLDLQLNRVVNDQVINAIANGCVNIQKLNITGCSINSWEQPSLTDVGLRSVSKLPHLVDLSMSYLANVTDDSLIAIAEQGKIKKLECRGCPTFTDAGCSRIVASCNELEFFDFSGCDVVTDSTVKAALEAVKLRSNNIKLTLIVGGSSVRHTDKFGKHSLLAVDTRDFCIPHLRPDFIDDIYFPPSENEDYDDDLCEFDWERHSLLFGDDIEYYEDIFEDDDDDEACAYAHFGFYC